MGTRDEYVEQLKSTFLSLGKSQVLKLLLAQLPTSLTTGFLGTLLNPIFGFLVGKILEIAIREAEIGAFFLFIDMRVKGQGKDFEEKMSALIEAQKSGDLERVAKAEKELKDAFRAFVRLTN